MESRWDLARFSFKSWWSWWWWWWWWWWSSSSSLTPGDLISNDQTSSKTNPPTTVKCCRYFFYDEGKGGRGVSYPQQHSKTFMKLLKASFPGRKLISGRHFDLYHGEGRGPRRTIWTNIQKAKMSADLVFQSREICGKVLKFSRQNFAIKVRKS